MVGCRGARAPEASDSHARGAGDDDDAAAAAAADSGTDAHGDDKGIACEIFLAVTPVVSAAVVVFVVDGVASATAVAAPVARVPAGPAELP